MAQGKVLIIHRYYRHRGGEDTFLDRTLLPALTKLGIPFELCKFDPFFSPSNRVESFFELLFMVLGWERLRPSYRVVRRKLCEAAGDGTASRSVGGGPYSFALFNNFIPTLSLRLPELARASGLVNYMWVHNSRAICANGLLFNGREDCMKCHTRGSRWAFLQNCHQSVIKSALYSWLYRFKRVERFLALIDKFVCNSAYSESFMKEIGAGRTTVVRMPPNEMIAKSGELPPDLESKLKTYSGLFYLYVGRVSYEKGADIFCKMALKYQEKAFVLCGNGPEAGDLKNHAPKNVIIFQATQDELPLLYQRCEALIVSSRVKETSSLVISEAYTYGTPIIYPEGGGAEETVNFLDLPGVTLNSFNGEKILRKTIQLSEVSKLRLNFENNLVNIFV